jgi:hypothetical protein
LPRRFEKPRGWKAGQGPRECQKDFIFDREWNRQFYATKRVRPIFVENPQEILVVTVYVYLFLKQEIRQCLEDVALARPADP